MKWNLKRTFRTREISFDGVQEAMANVLQSEGLNKLLLLIKLQYLTSFCILSTLPSISCSYTTTK